MSERQKTNRIANSHAEGYGKQSNTPSSIGVPPAYVRMVVVDVIFDPSIIDQKKLDYWEHEIGVGNIQYGATLPRNSIIAKRVLVNNATASEQPMFLYPFFPSHLALPCKPGEHVWVMYENPTAKMTDIGYWMCRITEPGYVDDVNHTHSPRQYEKTFNPNKKVKFDGNGEPIYEFRNGIVVNDEDNQRFVAPGTRFIDGDEDEYEKLISDTDAAKASQYEAVPRYRKRPGDMAIEGSNNTLIVWGTDRNDVVSEYEDDPIKGKIPKQPEADLLNSAGMLDIIAGRGQTEETGGVEVTSKKLSTNIDFKKELGKSANEVKENEGNPNLKTDRSRIRISQRTKVDKNLGLEDYNSQFSSDGGNVSDGPNGDGAIIVKTDKVRIIARSDLELLVMGPTQKDDDGRVIDNTDTSEYAAIVIKTNGDIVFKPSDKGVVKLGGDDANLAILCQAGSNGGGQVSAPPIIDSMGGQQGMGGVAGVFAKKVMIK